MEKKSGDTPSATLKHIGTYKIGFRIIVIIQLQF